MAFVFAFALLSAFKIRLPTEIMLFPLLESITTSVVPPTTETPTAMFPTFASASTLDSMMDFAVIIISPFVDFKLLFFTRTAEEAFATFTATPTPTLLVFIVSLLVLFNVMVPAVISQSSISMMVSTFFTFTR